MNQRSDSKLTKKMAELNCLLEVTSAINSSIDMATVLEMVLTESMRVLKAESGTLWLFDEEENALVPRVIKGPKASKLAGLKLGKDEGLAGMAFTQKKPILTQDVQDHSGWSSRFDKATGYKTTSLLTVPIIWKNEGIGCIQLVNKLDSGKFEQQDIRLSGSLANLSGAMITNARMHDEQKQLLMSVTKTLTAAIDARDPYTSGHSERVTRYALAMGRVLGFSSREMANLEIAGLLHDVGKIGIPDSIMGKKGNLTEDEYAEIQNHPAIGARIIDEMKPHMLLKKALEVALSHHEKYDGSGYPNKLAGEDIPLFARIVAVCDAFDAMTSDRPYRRALPKAQARQELTDNMGKHFDPQIVKIFIELLDAEVIAYDSI